MIFKRLAKDPGLRSRCVFATVALMTVFNGSAVAQQNAPSSVVSGSYTFNPLQVALCSGILRT
jgi:hypothetical protein